MRAFSKLGGIKVKYSRSSSQENLTNLIVFESNILDVININKIIDEFASKKARKRYL